MRREATQRLMDPDRRPRNGSARTRSAPSATRPCAAWAGSCAPTGIPRPRSSPPPTRSRSRAWPRPLRSAFPAHPGHVHGRLRRRRPLPELCWASKHCAKPLRRLVLAILRRPARWQVAASRPTCRNRPTGTTRPISWCGAPTCPRPARPTPTSIPKSATKAPRPWPCRCDFRQKWRVQGICARAKQALTPRHWPPPRDPEGIPPLGRVDLFPAIRAPLHRHAAAGKLLKERDGFYARPFLRASHLDGALGEQNNPDWKTLVLDARHRRPGGASDGIGFRWGRRRGQRRRERSAAGYLESPGRRQRADRRPTLTRCWADPTPCGGVWASRTFGGESLARLPVRNVPARRIRMADGGETLVATVYDLQCGQLRPGPRPGRRQRQHRLRR